METTTADLSAAPLLGRTDASRAEGTSDAVKKAAVSSPRRLIGASSKSLTPTILLGGGANALSVARSLGRMGVPVYALNESHAFVRHSRFCKLLDVGSGNLSQRTDAWTEFLLGPQSDHLAGSVLLTCSDPGIEILLAHRDVLEKKYQLDDASPAAQRAMLNKVSTYQAAVAAGVPTPRFWLAESSEQLEAVRDELVFPLIIKPRLSHLFEDQTGKKLVVAQDFSQVAAAVDAIAATGTGSMLCEMVPGPDERLCSYFTYLDEQSRPQFHFSKRIIRRYPRLMGSGCYHVTDSIPEAAELGNRLFRQVGLRGLANVEFKRDARDGQLKLIECNARFVASDSLVRRSGLNLAAYVYNRITGRPLPAMNRYRVGLRQLDPIRDFQAFRALCEERSMGLGSWLKSVLHRQTFPYFEWTDPMPSLARLTKPLRSRFTNAAG